MKGICLVAILYVAASTVAAVDELSQYDTIPTTCPETDSMEITIHLNHESDCTKYYVCVGGDKVEMRCPFRNKKGDRLHFNPVLQVCDWPTKAGCKSRTTTKSPTTAPPLTTLLPTTKPTTLPPTTLPPTTLPPTTLPPTTLPPRTLPTTTLPPKTLPPTTLPPRTLPTTTLPPKTLPPTTLPPTTLPPTTKPTTLPPTTLPPTTLPPTTLPPTTLPPTTLPPTTLPPTTLPPTTLQPTTLPPTTLPPTTLPPTTLAPTTIPPTTVPPTTTLSTINLPNRNCPADTNGKTIRLPHESICNEFYKCIDGETILTKCKRGYLFNAKHRVCDWPENVDCASTIPVDKSSTSTAAIVTQSTPPVDSTKCPSKGSILLPHEYVCSKYYECEEGNMILKRCPRNQHFDYVREICDLPEIVKCIRPLPKPTTDKPTTPITIATTTAKNNSPNECSAKEEGRKLSHETSCSLYYLCSNGKKLLERCITGLHFNVILQICDYPINAGCVLTTISDHTVTTVTATAPITTTNTATITTTPNVCPPRGSKKKVLLPHECSCAKYYECFRGNQILRHCPKGQHYDYIQQICDEPDIVKCVRPIPLPTVTTDVPTEITKPTRKPTETPTPTTTKPCSAWTAPSTVTKPVTVTKDIESTRTTLSSSLDQCPRLRGSKKVRLPHETHCKFYYLCEEGKRTLEKCTKKLLFNSLLRVCDWPENVVCKSAVTHPIIPPIGRITTESTSITIDRPTTCPPKGSFEKRLLPHECSCTKYYVCIDGAQVLQTCSAGRHFDYVRETCDKPEIVKCVRPIPASIQTIIPTGDSILPNTKEPFHKANDMIISGTCSDEDNGLYFPNENNCAFFYLCRNGLKILLECPNSLRFNPNLRVCDWPGNVKCI